MPQISFGNILREARERRGYDLTETARRLRIRPDILLAIEEEDFSRMPPHGYTRNMVNAYARLVGLNPTEITKMFLDANYAYRAGKVRSGSPRSAGRVDMGTSRLGGRARGGKGEEADGRPARANAFGRMVYDDRREYGRDYGQRNMDRIHAQDNTHQSRRPALNTQYTNFYAGPSNSGAALSKLPIFIAILVVVVLLAVVLSFTMCRHDSGGDTPTQPVSGLNDTTGTTTTDPNAVTPSGTYNSPATESAPTSVTVVYEVAASTDYPDGIYASINGEAEMVKGPVEKDVDVTDTWTFATWVTDMVTITCNGEKVEFNGADESGMPMATVKFSTYLDQWYDDHPNVKRPSGSSDSGSSGDQGGDSGSSGQTTGDGGADQGSDSADQGDGGAAAQDGSGGDQDAGDAQQ